MDPRVVLKITTSMMMKRHAHQFPSVVLLGLIVLASADFDTSAPVEGVVPEALLASLPMEHLVSRPAADRALDRAQAGELLERRGVIEEARKMMSPELRLMQKGRGRGRSRRRPNSPKNSSGSSPRRRYGSGGERVEKQLKQQKQRWIQAEKDCLATKGTWHGNRGFASSCTPGKQWTIDNCRDERKKEKAECQRTGHIPTCLAIRKCKYWESYDASVTKSCASDARGISREQCKWMAGELGVSMYATGCRSTNCAPRGCYKYTPDGNLYWNQHKCPQKDCSRIVNQFARFRCMWTAHRDAPACFKGEDPRRIPVCLR